MSFRKVVVARGVKRIFWVWSKRVLFFYMLYHSARIGENARILLSMKQVRMKAGVGRYCAVYTRGLDVAYKVSKVPVGAEVAIRDQHRLVLGQSVPHQRKSIYGSKVVRRHGDYQCAGKD